MSSTPTPDDIAALQAAGPAALLARAARDAGVDISRTWVVGGAVRDALLRREDGIDLDLVVVPAPNASDPADAGPSLARDLATRIPEAQLKATHTFGTATVLVPGASLGDGSGLGLVVDVATARTETYAHPGALPDVAATDDLVADMARRDFALNAMAWPLAGCLPDAAPTAADLVDPHDGLADLRTGTVRVLHDASFTDDPTRILRAARMAARFGTLDAYTRQLVADAVAGGALGTVSAQRITAELRISLRPADPSETFVNLWEWGVLAVLGLDPGPDPATMIEVLRSRVDPAAPEDTIELSRLAALLFAAGLDTLPDSVELPSRTAAEVVATARLARTLRAAQAAAVDDETLGTDLDTLRTIRDADPVAIVMLGAIGAAPARELLQIRQALTLTITGQHLLDLGLEPGPRVGELLGEVAERKLRGELPTAMDELAAAKALLGDDATTDGGRG